MHVQVGLPPFLRVVREAAEELADVAALTFEVIAGLDEESVGSVAKFVAPTRVMVCGVPCRSLTRHGIGCRNEFKNAIVDQPIVSDFFFAKAMIPGLVSAMAHTDHFVERTVLTSGRRWLTTGCLQGCICCQPQVQRSATAPAVAEEVRQSAVPSTRHVDRKAVQEDAWRHVSICIRCVCGCVWLCVCARARSLGNSVCCR